MPATSIAPYIDATGVHVPSYADIRTWLTAQYQTIFGADVYLGADSQDGQFLSVLSLALADWASDTVATYNAFSPATAQGAGLSSIVKINGLARAVPTASTVDVALTGTVGTAINNGVVQDTAGNKWNLPAAVVIPAAGTITVTATAQAAGAIKAPANSVTTILTPTRGWQTVNNASAGVPGAPVETDASLRRRQSQASQLPAVSALGSVFSGLGQVTGVTQVVIHENYTDAVDSAGVPGHTIAALVVGGNVADVAAMIALKKSPGCGTFGTTSVLTTDPNGLPITVNFSRPATLVVNVAVTVKALAGYSTNVTAEIQAALTNYINGLTVGQGLYFTRLYGPALLAGQVDAGTFEVTALTANGGAADIPAAYNQQLAAGTVVVTVT